MCVLCVPAGKPKNRIHVRKAHNLFKQLRRVFCSISRAAPMQGTTTVASWGTKTRPRGALLPARWGTPFLSWTLVATRRRFRLRRDSSTRARCCIPATSSAGVSFGRGSSIARKCGHRMKRRVSHTPQTEFSQLDCSVRSQETCNDSSSEKGRCWSLVTGFSLCCQVYILANSYEVYFNPRYADTP